MNPELLLLFSVVAKHGEGLPWKGETSRTSSSGVSGRQEGSLGRRVATGHVGEAMELLVVLLLPLCFPGLQAQTIQKLSQREGSNLSVLCHYTAEDEYRELKSWCRWTDQGCQLQVARSGTRTHFYTYRARQGHFTIKDDPIHKNFSITMTDLQVEDSGTYYCAYSQSYVLLKRISLNVFKGRVATTLSGTSQNYLPGNSTQAGNAGQQKAALDSCLRRKGADARPGTKRISVSKPGDMSRGKSHPASCHPRAPENPGRPPPRTEARFRPGLSAQQLLGLLRAESSPRLANPATRPRPDSATARQPCQGQHIATSCLRAGAASTASPQSAHTSLTSLQTLRTSPWAPAPGPCAVVPVK
ncbi:uncharacterized protein [Anas platyrhynchos]|uniref:uncharacterized protein isoform X3 n=1 Tax=Anas platyrhynchos TaxID=8839 RepID=UPI003AF219C2